MRPWANKNLKRALFLGVVIGLSSRASAQTIIARLQVMPESARVRIELINAPPTRWSFRDTYASMVGLGKRIENFQGFDDTGRVINVRKLAPGQFESALPVARVTYEVDLPPPVMPSDAAMVSWATKDRGLLRLGDLLPVTASEDRPVPANIALEIPYPYAIFPLHYPDAPRSFPTDDVASTVFAFGKALRAQRIEESGMTLDLLVDGEWAFTDMDVLDLARKILKAHRQIFGGTPAALGRLILFPFPENVAATQWAAETRGSTVTLLMGISPSKVGALAQLSAPLTHELFHLWVPNGLTLKGDYDWFYEGFTMYESARVAVALDLLTFQEFLNAIARAYDAYLSDAARDRWSLVEASERRWTGGSSSVYSKSMVIALLIDLKIRSESGNKKSLAGIYEKLLAKFPQTQRATIPGTNGNDAVLALLKGDGPIADWVTALITKAIAIDLPKEIAAYGFSMERSGSRTRLSVDERLTKRQRDLLRELGYNAAGHSVR